MRIGRLATPRQLHFVWVGKPMPSHLMENIYEWERLHNSWSLRIWHERDLRWLRNVDIFDNAAKFVPSDAVGQFKSDLARYEIVHRFGGFYADVDTRPLQPIDDSVLHHSEFAVQEDLNWIGNTYIGGTAGNPLFNDIITGIPRRVNPYRQQRPNIISGPKFITPIWRAHGGHVAPQSWGFPYSYTHVKRGTVPETFEPDTFAVHQWQHTQEVMEARRGRR